MDLWGVQSFVICPKMTQIPGGSSAAQHRQWRRSGDGAVARERGDVAPGAGRATPGALTALGAVELAFWFNIWKHVDKWSI